MTSQDVILTVDALLKGSPLNGFNCGKNLELLLNMNVLNVEQLYCYFVVVFFLSTFLPYGIFDKVMEKYNE